MNYQTLNSFEFNIAAQNIHNVIAGNYAACDLASAITAEAVSSI
jgi:hypothetical protein